MITIPHFHHFGPAKCLQCLQLFAALHEDLMKHQGTELFLLFNIYRIGNMLSLVLLSNNSDGDPFGVLVITSKYLDILH